MEPAFLFVFTCFGAFAGQVNLDHTNNDELVLDNPAIIMLRVGRSEILPIGKTRLHISRRQIIGQCNMPEDVEKQYRMELLGLKGGANGHRK